MTDIEWFKEVLKNVTTSLFMHQNQNLQVIGDDDKAFTVTRTELKDGERHRTYRIDWSSIYMYYEPAGTPTYSIDLSISHATNFVVNAIREWYNTVTH